jgi:hypothetical protein
LVSWLSDNYESIHPKDNLDLDFGLNRTGFRHVFLNGEQLINGRMMMDTKKMEKADMVLLTRSAM